MQKAMMIQTPEDVKVLNSYLSDRWFVVQSCPMPSSRNAGSGITKATLPTCLIIIEKRKDRP
jgi:hypothetical protein